MTRRDPKPRRCSRLALLLLAFGSLAAAPGMLAQPAASGTTPAVLVLPVELPLALLQPAIREGFPMETDRETEWNAGRPLADGSAVRYQIYFFRGPARLALDGADLVLRFDEVQYRLRAEITRPSGKTVAGSCGYGDQWPRRARILGRSEITWGERWRLATRTAFAPPELLDPCRVADGTDLGPQLEAGLTARLVTLAGAIDRALAEQANVRGRFEAFWQALGKPVELVEGTWLEMRPSAAAAGPIGGDGEALRTRIALTLSPQITLTAPAAAPADLPPLRIAAMPASGLRLRVPFVASYAEVESRLAGDLVGIEIPVVPGRAVRIESLRVEARSPSIGVLLGLGGVIDGTALLVGRVLLAPDGVTLQLTDLSATIETSGRLAQAMSGLTEKALVAAVEKYARIDLTPRLERLRRGLLAALNRELAPGIWLQGDVAPLRAESLSATVSGIELALAIEMQPRVDLR